MTDEEFWDAAAIACLRGLMTNAGDVPVESSLVIPKHCANIADVLLAERRARRENAAEALTGATT